MPFWVGGNGNITDAANHWAATTGGAPGAGNLPSSTTDATFDANSGAGAVVTVDGAFSCRDFSMAAAAGSPTLAGSAALNVFGNLAKKAAQTWTYSGILTFKSTATGKTITSAGVSYPGSVVFDGIGGGWTLADAISAQGNVLTITNGSLASANFAVTILGLFSIAAAGSVTWGTSAVSAGNWSVDVGSTYSGASATLDVGVIGNGANFSGGGKSYGATTFKTNIANRAFAQANTFASLILLCTAARDNSIAFSAGQTVTGALKYLGDSILNRLLVHSDTMGTARTITAGSITAGSDYTDFRDITGAGAAAPFATGGSLGDCQGNSGITFTTPATQTATGTASFTWSTHGWTTRVPLPQDDVVVNNAFVAGRTVTLDMPRLGKSISFAGVTGSPTVTGSGFMDVYGSYTLSSGIGTYTTPLAISMRGRGAHTITSAGKTFAQLNIYAPGGSYTLSDAFVSNSTIDFGYGTFDANDFSFQAGSIRADNTTAAKTVDLGNGLWTVTGSIQIGQTWRFGNGTPVTVIPGTSTIKFTDTSANLKTFDGGGKTYNNIWFSGAGSGSYQLTGSNTFNQFKTDESRTVAFTAGTTTTAADWQFGAGSTIGSATAASHTLAKTDGGTVTGTSLTISRSTATPNNTFFATNSLDNGNNVGWTFTYARYFTQFEDSDINDNPPFGFSEQWNAAAGTDTSATVLYSNNATVKKRYVYLAPSMNDAWRWDALGSLLTDVDIAFAVTTAIDGTDCASGVTMRASGGIGAQRGYYAVVRPTDELLEVGAIGGSPALPVPLATYAYVFAAGGHYHCRAQVRGTTLKMKVWRDIEDEPTAWQITTTSSLYSVGWVGIYGFSTGGGENAGNINYLSLGTGTYDAPRALSNYEYFQWVSQPVERRILAEFSATGFDASGGYASPSNYLSTVRVYIGNGGFVSKAWDNPPSHYYPPWIKRVPTFRREMSTVLSGKAATNFGSLVVSNPAGIRDDWFSMRWKKESMVLLMGDASWPRHDFRTIVFGYNGQPGQPAQDEIDFPISDMSGIFENDANPDKFTSGDYLDQRIPRLYGYFGFAPFGVDYGQVEPPKTDDANNIYTLCNETIADWYLDSNNYLRVYDDQVEIVGNDCTVASVAGNVITTSVPHGALDRYLVRFISGTPPTPLALNTDYWMAAFGSPLAIGASTFTLVEGGPFGTPVILTSGTTGAAMKIWGYTVTEEGPATIRLFGNPAGRVTAKYFYSTVGSGQPLDVLQIIAMDAGLTSNNIVSLFDLGGGDEGFLGYWLGTEKVMARDLMQAIATGTFTWHGFSFDGLFEIGDVALPEDIESASVLDLVESDIKEGTLRLVRAMLPIDFSAAEIRRYPWFLRGGPFQLGAQAALQGYSVEAPTVYPVPAPPLSDYPNAGDMDPTLVHTNLYVGDSVAPGNSDYWRSMLSHKIGVYEMQTRLKAMDQKVSIGRRMTLVHSRLGWEGSTTEAVIIGVDVDLSGDNVYPVKLTVFRPLVGLYPTGDLT